MGDYRNLWESLGMDLEKHDVLCQALPPLFDEIYLSQVDRPQGMNYFNFVIAEIHGLRVEELHTARIAGRKVFGTFCVFVPTELITACDGIAVGLCGGSQFWVPDGEKVLPRNLCPLIKASVGAKISGTCPYFQSCDLLVGETTCDGKKKAWEILNEYTPTYVMDLPQMKREKDLSNWRDEVSRFCEQVEALTEQKITSDNLRQAIHLANEKRRVLSRLYGARKADPVPISGKDALLISQIAFYDDPERFITQTDALCEELEKRIDQGTGVFPKSTPRILISGTPQAIPNWKLHHIIENSGAVIVCEETCTGTRYFENMVDEGGETVDEQMRHLADRYMGVNCACFTPNTGRVDDIVRLAKEYHADGVVHYNLPFCHNYSIEYHQVERALKQEGIPVIKVETDYGEEDSEQIRTRIEAFIEILR